jgi:MFS transporter, FSR family, fosmidomycin resistance protein
VRDANRILWLTGTGHASSHAWELIFPAVAVPMARDLGLPFEDTVSIGFILYLLFGLGAPVAGWASDRLGPRRVLILCLLGGGVSGALVAFAPTLPMVRIALGGLGLAASLYHPAGLAMLSHHFERKVGRAFALNGIAGNIGIGLTPFLAGLIASLFGWRYAYLLLCLPGLLFGIIFLFVRVPDGPTSRAEHSTDRTPLDWRPIALFAVATIAGGLAYRLHTLVMPALIQERIPLLTGVAERFTGLEHVDNLGATALTSVAYGFGVFGQWAGGKIADKHPLAPSYFWFHLIATPILALAAVASGLPLLLALFGYVFFSIGMQPIENSLIAKLTPPLWRGRGFAAKFILSFGVGAFGTYVVGWVHPLGGLGASLMTATACELVLVMAVGGIWALDRLTIRSPRASPSSG